MSEFRSVVSREDPVSTAESEAQPRGLQLLFVIFILAGMILIAIGYASLIAGMKRGTTPNARGPQPEAKASLIV